METKRIVITGGPGSGKTALIKFLEEKGHAVKHEISRDIILEAQKQGIEQLFLEDPLHFSSKLLEGRLEQFHEAEQSSALILFYDRGLPDVTAYLEYACTQYPEHFLNTCSKNRYDLVFVLPPWESIYQQDNERYESFGQAEKIYHSLKNSYINYGYTVQEVPVGSIEERVGYILDFLKNNF